MQTADSFRLNWRTFAVVVTMLVTLSGGIGAAVSRYATASVQNAQRDDKLHDLDSRLSAIETLAETNDRALTTISTQFNDLTATNEAAHGRLEVEIKEVKQLLLARNHERNQYPLNGSIDNPPAAGRKPALAAANTGR